MLPIIITVIIIINIIFTTSVIIIIITSTVKPVYTDPLNNDHLPIETSFEPKMVFLFN